MLSFYKYRQFFKLLVVPLSTVIQKNSVKMISSPFKSIAVFLFVFTFTFNKYANGYTEKEVPALRSYCWEAIQYYFNGGGNNSIVHARHAWDSYTLAIVGQMRMPLDAIDYYGSFKEYLSVSGSFQSAKSYCRELSEGDLAKTRRCRKQMREVFGGKDGPPDTDTDLVMYERSLPMLLEIDDYDERKYSDYMIPYWITIRNKLFVNASFPCAQKFCEDRYSYENAKPVLYNFFPTTPDLGKNV